MLNHHVPSVDTRTYEDIAFSEALKHSLSSSITYDVSHWLFVPNTYTEYRYILGTRGNNPLICVGVNPSTAAPDHLDPTLQSVQRIALHNGYDSFLMFNVYAQRATSPKNMDRSCHKELHQENLNAFRYALSLSARPAVWAAWGNIIETRDYLYPCLCDIIEASLVTGASWYHCGLISKKGHPHHPLYLRKDEPLLEFDIQSYLRFLQAKGKTT